MKVALLIQNYHTAKERVGWMWHLWKRAGWGLFGVDTEDRECFWPEQIISKKIGIDAYIHAGHLPKKLADCVRWFLTDPVFDGYTHCCIIENDTAIFRTPPEVDIAVSAILAGGPLRPMKASCFFHNPWFMSRVACAVFLKKADELLLSGDSEFGNPDFFFGYVWDKIGIAPTHIEKSFTQNSIIESWQIKKAKEAIDSGAWVVHGIKTKDVLDLLEERVK